MADHDETVASVHLLRNRLCAETLPEPHKIMRIIQKLSKLPITVEVLQETAIGKAVNSLRKQGGEIAEYARRLVHGWKELVREAMEAEQQLGQNFEPSPDEVPPRDHKDDSDVEEECCHDGGGNYSNEDSSDDSPRCQSNAMAQHSPVRERKQYTTSFTDSPKKSMSDQRHDNAWKDQTSAKRKSESLPQGGAESPKKMFQDSQSTSTPPKKQRKENDSFEDFVPDPKKINKIVAEDSSLSKEVYRSPQKIKKLSPSYGSSNAGDGSQSLKKPKESVASGYGSSSNATKKLSAQSSKKTTHSPKKTTHSPKKTTPSSQKTAESSRRALKGSSVSDGVKTQFTSSPDSERTTNSEKNPTMSKRKSAVVNGSVKQLTKGGNAQVKATETPVSSKPKLSKGDNSTTASSVGKAMKTKIIKEGDANVMRTHEKSDKKVVKVSEKKVPVKSIKDAKNASSKTVTQTSGNDGKLAAAKEKNPSAAKSVGVDERKRRRSSSDMMSSGDEERNYKNTGMSFADCLLGPMPVPKPKKSVKRLDASSQLKSKNRTPVTKSSSSSSSLKSSSSSKVAVSSRTKSEVPSSKLSSVKVPASSASKPKTDSGKGNNKSRSEGTEELRGKGNGKDDGDRSQKSNSEKEKSELQDRIPALVHIDVLPDITFNLPEISTDYKPMRLPEVMPKKKMNGPGDDGSYIGSKHARTKVFSGKARTTWTHVPSLYEICMRILCDNIDALYEVGVPYEILKPVLEKCTPHQLLRLEDYNPYLLEDTDPLWQIHADKDFKRSRPGEMETWRELYIRKLDEREQRLKNVTANISAAMAKKDPGRLTKMAFVDRPAKPPRNVMRQQVRHGTATITLAPATSPHKPYVPSKHAGDQSSSSSTSYRSSSSIGSSAGASSSSSSVARDRVVHSSKPAKVIAPMWQKALKMKKKLNRR